MNTVLNLIADRTLPYFDAIPKLPCKLHEVVCWNVTSLNALDSIGLAKLKTIGAIAHQAPVLLQETKWTAPSLQRIRQAMSRVQAVASLAVLKDNGLSGGVAICLPQNYQLIETVEILPGFALAGLVKFRTVSYWLLSVYWHHDQWGQLLHAVSHFVREAEHMVVLGGDLNSVDLLRPGDYNHLPAQGDLVGPLFDHFSPFYNLQDLFQLLSWRHKGLTGGHHLIKIRFRSKEKLVVDSPSIPVRTVPCSTFNTIPEKLLKPTLRTYCCADL